VDEEIEATREALEREGDEDALEQFEDEDLLYARVRECLPVVGCVFSPSQLSCWGYTWLDASAVGL
jgi:hypothetical protein